MLAYGVPRRDEGRPRDVAAGAAAVELDGTHRAPVHVAPQMEVELGSRGGHERAIAFGRGEIGRGRTVLRESRLPAAQRRVVGQADRPDDAADRGRCDQGERDRGGKPFRPNSGLGYQLAADAEAGEQGCGEEGRRPRIDDLGRRQQRLRGRRHDLAGDAGNRGHQQKARYEPEPEDPGRSPIARDEGRPDDGRDADEERQGGRDADEQVQWTTGPIRQQYDTAARGPQDRQTDGQKPQLEKTDAHARSLAARRDGRRPPARPPPANTSTARQYGTAAARRDPGRDPRFEGRLPHLRVSPPKPGSPNAPSLDRKYLDR